MLGLCAQVLHRWRDLAYHSSQATHARALADSRLAATVFEALREVVKQNHHFAAKAEESLATVRSDCGICDWRFLLCRLAINQPSSAEGGPTHIPVGVLSVFRTLSDASRCAGKYLAGNEMLNSAAQKEIAGVVLFLECVCVQFKKDPRLQHGLGWPLI